MIKIVIGLVSVIIANTLLGVKLASIKKELNYNVLCNGLLKSLCILISISLMYLCSYYNPDIFIANIDGININLISGMKSLFIAGITYYGFQDLNKLQQLLRTKVNIQEVNNDSVIVIDRNDKDEI